MENDNSLFAISYLLVKEILLVLATICPGAIFVSAKIAKTLNTLNYIPYSVLHVGIEHREIIGI